LEATWQKRRRRSIPKRPRRREARVCPTRPQVAGAGPELTLVWLTLVPVEEAKVSPVVPARVADPQGRAGVPRKGVALATPEKE
jgi:hypothetical protein